MNFKSLLSTNRFRSAVVFGFVVVLTARLVSAEVLIPPTDPNINYYGRFDMTNPAQPKFDWSGSTIEAAFSGTSIGVELVDGSGYYDVEIDGVAQPVINTSATTHYTISTTLTNANHVVRLILRSETDIWGNAATFKGFYVTTGTQLVAHVKPVRKMEFCGDSYTAAYGTESSSRTCTYDAKGTLNSTTNTNKSWARLTSKAFHAQDIIVAKSGIGLVSSLSGAATYPTVYPRTLYGGTAQWNFSSWIPDVVTIFLGINDKNSGATAAAFTSMYHTFFTTIRGNYPNAAILVMAASGSMDSAAKAAVAAETTTYGHKKIYYVTMPTIQGTGCDYHPSVADHVTISKTVIPALMKDLNWDTSASTALLEPLASSRMANRDLRVSFGTRDDRGLIVRVDPAQAHARVQVLDIGGRLMDQGEFDQRGTFRLNASHMLPGLYLIGNSSIGWIKATIGSVSR